MPRRVMATPGAHSAKSVAIIGGGYSGLALANILAKTGYTVDVFEKNSTLGGRISFLKKDGFLFDTGPSWYLMPEVFEQYYSLFNINAKKELDLVRLKPGYRAFFEHQPSIDLQGALKADAKTFESIEPGAGKTLEKYIRTSSLAYNIATKRFLYSNFRSIFDIMRADILRASPRMLTLVGRPLHAYVTSKFKDARLQKVLEYHMVFLGSSPFQAPALYTLMSHLDFQSGIFYPKRGMYALVESLVSIGESLGVRYRTNSPVAKIVTKNGVATGVRLEDGTLHVASTVVSAGDLHFTETKLLSASEQTYPEAYWKKRQPGPSALVLLLGVKGKLPGLLHHNLFLVDDWKSNFQAIYETKKTPEHASLYICNPSKTDPTLAPKNHENIFVLLPLPSGVSYTKKQANDLADTVIMQLGAMLKEPNLAERIVTRHVNGPNDYKDAFNAWELNAFGGESHLLFQSVIFRTGNKSRKVKNLYYTGAGTLPGIGLPMCLISAQMTYKRMVGDRRGGPLRNLEGKHHV